MGTPQLVMRRAGLKPPCREAPGLAPALRCHVALTAETPLAPPCLALSPLPLPAGVLQTCTLLTPCSLSSWLLTRSLFL